MNGSDNPSAVVHPIENDSQKPGYAFETHSFASLSLDEAAFYCCQYRQAAGACEAAAVLGNGARRADHCGCMPKAAAPAVHPTGAFVNQGAPRGESADLATRAKAHGARPPHGLAECRPLMATCVQAFAIIDQDCGRCATLSGKLGGDRRESFPATRKKIQIG
jgi:hypothetical protein